MGPANHAGKGRVCRNSNLRCQRTGANVRPRSFRWDQRSTPSGWFAARTNRVPREPADNFQRPNENRSDNVVYFSARLEPEPPARWNYPFLSVCLPARLGVERPSFEFFKRRTKWIATNATIGHRPNDNLPWRGQNRASLRKRRLIRLTSSPVPYPGPNIVSQGL